MTLFTHKALFALSGIALLLLLSGCIQDKPADSDVPWAKPAQWEGTIPLPSSFQNDGGM